MAVYKMTLTCFTHFSKNLDITTLLRHKLVVYTLELAQFLGFLI